LGKGSRKYDTRPITSGREPEALARKPLKTPFRPKPYQVDNTNPFYRYDPDQCILCGRCVEACQNFEVNETLSIRWEDPHPRVLWDGGKAIGESSCVSCGHCVTVCPCNALMEKSMLGEAGYMTGISHKALTGMIDIVKGIEPELGYGAILRVSEIESEMRKSRIRRTKTVCTYCGVGCSFDVWTRDRHILKIEPLEGPANGISTCVKGKFGWDYVNNKDRLTKPLIREGSRFREATWDEALALVASKLAELKRDYGADSIGLIASSKCTNEELRGQKLIVADLRKNEMAERADIHLKPRPNTDLVWLSAISRYLIDQGLAKMSFVDQWVNGLAEYKKSLEPFTLEFAERVSGIPAATLKQVAEMVAAADGVAICWAMGVTQHSNGSDTSTAISNLLLVTGNYMRPGTGAYPLRGHNNVQGASDMGRDARSVSRLSVRQRSRDPSALANHSRGSKSIRCRLELPASFCHHGW
jgi:predicted molibdopterin-dependent oxidoreductase YjgC